MMNIVYLNNKEVENNYLNINSVSSDYIVNEVFNKIIKDKIIQLLIT